MNYEELLESRNGAAMGKESMPFGQFYKKMVNGKYENVVDLRNDLKDSLLFCDAITADSEHSKKFNHKHQLPFTLTTDSAGESPEGIRHHQRGRHHPWHHRRNHGDGDFDSFS